MRYSSRINATVYGEVTVQGVKAFLPISEISAERIREVSDALKIDDVINAVVLELDKREWRMKISIKALTEKKERAIFDKYKEYMLCLITDVKH